MQQMFSVHPQIQASSTGWCCWLWSGVEMHVVVLLDSFGALEEGGSCRDGDFW